MATKADGDLFGGMTSPGEEGSHRLFPTDLTIAVEVQDLRADSDTLFDHPIVKAKKISTDDELKVALETISIIKKVLNKADGLVKKWLAPAREEAEKIKKRVAEMTDPLDDLKKDLAKWAGEYQSAKEKAVAEARRLQQEQEAKAKETGRRAKPALYGAPSPTAPVSNVVKTDTTTSHFRNVLRVRIIDPNAVPREYCIPDESFIREKAESFPYDGTTIHGSIPGVELRYEKVPIVK